MIEIIPKPTAKLPLWQNILFYFSIALLILSIVSYFGLGYFQKKSEEALRNYEKMLASAQTPEEKVLEEEIKTTKKKIDDFSLLIEAHQFSSNLFPLLERITHPKVYFSNIRFNSKEKKVDLSCQTESFLTLGEQILILRKEKEIQNIDLTGVGIGGEGKIVFSLSLLLDPQVLK